MRAWRGDTFRSSGCYVSLEWVSCLPFLLQELSFRRSDKVGESCHSNSPAVHLAVVPGWPEALAVMQHATLGTNRNSPPKALVTSCAESMSPIPGGPSHYSKRRRDGIDSLSGESSSGQIASSFRRCTASSQGSSACLRTIPARSRIVCPCLPPNEADRASSAGFQHFLDVYGNSYCLNRQNSRLHPGWKDH